MTNFQYRALKADGSVVDGSVDTANRPEALRRLETLGLQPIRVEEKKVGGEKADSPKSLFHLNFGKSGRITFRTLENFTRQLSSLLSAGVPLARSLQILCRESSSQAARDKWREVHDLVIDGMSLAEAMSRSPEVFPQVYVAMVQAGETGGFLDVVLGQIAEFQLREKELRSRVITALIYPAVLLTLALGVLIFLLTFFIPRFQMIFQGFGAALPLLTQIIVWASGIATRYGIFVVAIIGIGVLMARGWLKTEAGRRAWQQTLLRLPIIGSLVARFAMTRFCRMLGTLISAGVPLIHALRVARESIGNQTLVDAVSNSIERVMRGESLAASLADCHTLFPASVIEMIAVGEETGRLDQELVRLASVTDNDLDRQLRTAVSLAEPLLLFMMAAFIGTIFIGMVLPIFSIQEYIK